MDVDTDISQYFQVIENQKRVLQQAKIRKGQRPRDRTPKGQMYMEFMMALMATSTMERSKKNNLIHSSFIPPAYLPCITPLAQLTPIAIDQLTLETHHRGKYLLLKAITPPNRMTGILLLAEDEYEDVVVLQLYQQEEENIRPATDVVDVGTTLLIKEPYFKIMASGDYGLRVDHLSDVLRIDQNDPILPKRWCPRITDTEGSAEISKSEGDFAMGEGRYWKAIEKYSEAISQKPTSDRVEIIKRNRSLAYLKTKQFDNALCDTGFPNFGPNPSEKALFRAAEALYFLRRFDESSHVLDTIRSTFPHNKQASTVSIRAQCRRSEADTGVYDFKLLQKEARKLQPPHLDHATYVGPVKVQKVPGKGRGLFVTKPVKAGDLLLCEKAFSHAYVVEGGSEDSSIALLINSETNRGFLGGQASLIKLIVQKMHCNPSLAAAFTALHHGNYKPASTSAVDGRPVVDTFLVEQIMTFNVFGCPRSSLQTYKNAASDQSKQETAYHSCGIWIQASYINHGCTSNVRRSFIGDMMIVRATRDLEPGDEITFWYHAPNGKAKELQEKLQNWQFACTCAICEDDRVTTAATTAKRNKLLEELKLVLRRASQHQTKLGKAKDLLQALKNTYTRPTDEVPRLLLWDPQALLTRIYLAQGKWEKALESFMEVLSLLGFVVSGADCTPEPFKILKWGLLVDHLIEAFMEAQGAFKAIGLWNDSKTAEGYAKIAYKIVVGEDTSFESISKSKG
ncbi:uncharacterized protein EKO05_0001775 [Ascochyta rabiei]|uniref:Uncharacterized protein n=1 Tax=Didymella rabiei TaxID=5454 RepID=A0A163BJB6_DIDRA|nr:uncharacterized protein EKO05_0001775 [Ascochyta rabiei]KZM21802.1 hypothetical protein ST47_g7171 [Ascochyta rabiei]UPX11153.1 hypothetical protein EKO05_0001775 [Ascochyta rabiei]